MSDEGKCGVFKVIGRKDLVVVHQEDCDGKCQDQKDNNGEAS